MLDENSKLWWDEITGPSSLILEIVTQLQSAKSIILYVQEDLPWRKQMRSSVEGMLNNNDPDLLISYVDCKRDCADIRSVPEFILKTFALPEVRNGYRVSSGIPIHKYIMDSKALENRIIWVKGMNRQQVSDWYNFCKSYQARTRYNGLFVIESYEELTSDSVASHIRQLRIALRPRR